MRRDYWPTEQWKAIPSEIVGMNSGKLLSLSTEINSHYRNMNGIIIVRKGYVVYENYFRRKNNASTYNVASVTKSITSALVGIAIQKGYIESVDERVVDFFPEYAVGPIDKRKQKITLRHLLTMTAPYPFKNWHEPLDRMRRQSDWVMYALDLLGQGGRIGTFKYSTAGAHLLSAVISSTTGKCAREFANENLFQPIGMAKIPDNNMQTYDLEAVFGRRVQGWVHDPSGNSTGGWGLTLTLRDMARFGYLYLNNGLWDGKQIVSDSWIAESTSMNKNKYGYLWWLRQTDGVFSYAAVGDGGNMICCIPEKDMVIAIASHIIRRPRDRWDLIEKHILPAIE